MPLKLRGEVPNLYVALYMSAWIEIHTGENPCLYPGVALHVSAWIEIHTGENPCLYPRVALHVSAWIEINLLYAIHAHDQGRTPCGVRGLKSITDAPALHSQVALCMECVFHPLTLRFHRSSFPFPYALIFQTLPLYISCIIY